MRYPQDRTRGRPAAQKAADPCPFTPVKQYATVQVTRAPEVDMEVDMDMAWWLGPTVYRAHVLAAVVEWDGPAMFLRAYLQP